MSLEIPSQKKKESINLTPEMIEALEKGYEMEVEHLRDKNLKYLKKADQIESIEDRKRIIISLGRISVEAANVNEELQRSLN